MSSDGKLDRPSLFSALLDHSFKGISFPATSFSLTLRHDLAIHKIADKDGAEIEATGRAPLQFEARIPFINSIDKGPNEQWEQPLYPKVFRAFWDAVAEKATGKLVHPEFGPILCKTEMAKADWQGATQNGIFVDVQWIETVEDVATAIKFFSSRSPVAAIAEAAAIADAIIRGTNYPDVVVPPELRAPTGILKNFSFQDAANSIRAIADAPSLLNQQIGGKIDSLVASAKSVAASLDKTSDPRSWLLVQQMQRIISASNGLRETILAERRGIVLWPVRVDMTFGNIAAQTGADMSDLFVLNPSLLRAPVVPAGSTIRYYAAA